jgi:hypothetical protein
MVPGLRSHAFLPVLLHAQEFLKLDNPASDSRFYRPEGNIQNQGDLFVGTFFQVEER